MNAFHDGGTPPFGDGPDDHFDEVTGVLFLEGQLDAGRAQEVSVHLNSCDGCRRLLRALQNENVWLCEVLRADEEAVPARLLSAPERGKAHWGWIAALGFGFGGAYTFWAGLVAPWLDQAGQAGFSQGSLLTMLFFTGALWKGWDAMRTAMELFAAITLGVLGIWLLRRQLRRFTPVALVMGAFALFLALAPSAAAT